MPPTSDLERKIRRGTSGLGERCSIRLNSASRATEAPRKTRVRGSVQPASGASDIPGDQEEHRSRHGQGSGQIEAAQAFLVDALGEQAGRDQEDGESDGDVDEEDPLPAEALRHRPTNQQAGGRTDPAQTPPDPQRPVPIGALGKHRH